MESKLGKATYSFIVPVYNAESSLERCVDSILAGIHDNDDEIILIDDGSSDQSKIICENYARLHDNIKVVHQKNTGGAGARNTGIKISSKEWLIFVDADDFLDSNYRKYLEENVDGAYDYILFSYLEEDTQLKKTKILENKNQIVELSQRDRNDLVLRCFRAQESFAGGVCNLRSVWSKVFKRSFIVNHKLEFPEGMITGEDVIFMVQVYSMTSRAKFVPNIFYHYFFCNSASVTNRYKPNLKNNVIASDIALADWLKCNPHFRAAYQNNRLRIIIRHLRDDFFHKDNLRNNWDNKKHVKEVMLEGKYREAYQEAKQSGEIKIYPVSSRIVFWLAIHGQYNILKFICHIKYGTDK